MIVWERQEHTAVQPNCWGSEKETLPAWLVSVMKKRKPWHSCSLFLAAIGSSHCNVGIQCVLLYHGVSWQPWGLHASDCRYCLPEGHG